MVNQTELRESLKSRFTHELSSLERGDLHHEVIQDIQASVFATFGAEPTLAYQSLAAEVLYEVIGFGPLLALMTDPTVNEIMVNGTQHIFVERNGTNQRTPYAFESPRHLRYLLQRLMHLAPGKRLDEQSPMVDLSLPDGSRVNIVLVAVPRRRGLCTGPPAPATGRVDVVPGVVPRRGVHLRAHAQHRR